MNRILCHCLALALLVTGLSGCATVQYGDAGSAKAVSVDFGSSDLQQIAAAMTDSLVTSPAVLAVAKDRPVLIIDTVKNKTMQHIDTESVTDSIRTRLIRSGQFRFLDRSTDDALLKELRVQQESGMVDPAATVRLGKQLGARYILTSNLSEIRQKDGRTTDTYYKFTMNLKNLETGLLEWADEKEIRKTRTKGFFGG